MWQLLNFFNPTHYGRRHEDEIPEYIKNYLKEPIVVFKLSFIAGTVLFLLYIVTRFEGLLVIGHFYVVITALINLIVFGVFMIMAIINYRYGLLILQKTSVQLLNIPIALLYFNIILPG